MTGPMADPLQSALDEFRAGRLAEAERLCHIVLARDPRYARALNLLAVIALQSGNLQAAEGLLRQAVACDAARRTKGSRTLYRIYFEDPFIGQDALCW